MIYIDFSLYKTLKQIKEHIKQKTKTILTALIVY